MIRKLYNTFLEFKPGMIKYVSLFPLVILMNSQKTINAFVTALFIDGVSQEDLHKLKVAIIVGLVSFAGISIAKYIEKIWTIELKQGMDLKIRERILKNIKGEYMNEINKLSQGDMQQRFLNDIEETTEIFFAKFFNLIAPFIMIIVSFFYLVQINVVIAFVVTVFSPVLGVIFEQLRLKMKRISILLWEEEMSYREFQQNLVDGLKVIVNYQKIRFILKKDRRRQKQVKKHNMRVAKLIGFGYGLALSVVYFVQITAIVLGFLEIRKGILTVGELVALMTLVGNLVAGFSGFGRTIGDLQKSIVSAGKVFGLLGKSTENNGNEISNIAKKEIFIIENLEFGYQEKVILNDLNFICRKNEKILIKGSNGQGKSTIFKIMLGLYKPQMGQVYYCGINIKDYSSNVIKNLNWLPTDDYFYTESIGENIFWTDNLGTDEIERYNVLADYFNFRFNLEDNLEADKLSGGEKQKIKLIRCFRNDAEVYLLDEPVKALDMESRIAFKNFVKEQLRDKAIIIIDHNNFFDDFADTVYEIDAGKLKLLSSIG